MNLLAALVLLVSCSDDFAALSPQWRAGARGWPDISFATVEGDKCLVLRAPGPGAADLVREFPRPVLRSERPMAVAHIYLPDFSTWPTTNGNYAGFRLTVQDQYPRYLWPGIFISRTAGVPTLTARVLTDTISRNLDEAGWHTLGIRSDGGGVLAFYAARGRVDLTDEDRFFTDDTGWTQVSSMDGWFLQCGTPEPWYFGDVQLYADIRPFIDMTRTGMSVSLNVSGGYPGEPVQIERSTDLHSWQAFEGFVDTITEPQQFYRIR